MKTPLVDQRCKPLEGHPPMTRGDIESHLAQHPGWSLVDGAIQKSYSFEDYHRTMSFINALAWIAHAEDHHPDLHVSYSRCTVRFNTHSVGGISVNDFICAAKVDALLLQP
ncbi:MAG TPA: 4a-hydroxytetrahydrobiopterin dehydratase [Rubrivivax sp.]|nr:4a-hydroxytetrahydrobiopterin dehydratase [Rubrivivax sp.]